MSVLPQFSFFCRVLYSYDADIWFCSGLPCVCVVYEGVLVDTVDEESREMGDLGTDESNQLDWNMWAPEEEDSKEPEVCFRIIIIMCTIMWF